jgi:Arylsulfotransferase (ASST)
MTGTGGIANAARMRRREVLRFVSLAVLAVGLFGAAFVAGAYYRKAKELVMTVVREAPILTRKRPLWHLQPARYEGDGVTINETQDDDRVLLAGFFEQSNEIRLIRRDGSLVARWPLAFSEIVTDTRHIPHPPATDWNVDIHGALILPDGSVVFNFEGGGLVKLDRCGKVVWTVAKGAHHSVERAEGGGYWVPSSRYVEEEATPRFPPFKAPYREDTILKISDDGQVLLETSLIELLYRNNMEALLTANTEWLREDEITHLNKVAELSTEMARDFPMFAPGDLLLSIRGLNAVLVVDLDAQRVKWWSIGPWIRQHDPEFKAGGTISVFNNNAYPGIAATGDPFGRFDPSLPRVSNIIEMDPATNEHRITYGGVNGQEMLTVIRGKHELTARGGLLITEFEGGRVFETDRNGRIVWQFINRYDESDVAEITEARIYPPEYFEVRDWSCDR